jgi:glutaredoxin
MKFTVYSKHGCPYCTKVLQVLNHVSTEKGYPIVEYTLGTHFSKDDFYAEFGQGSTFPQVVCDDTHIGGCSDTVKYLKENSIV